MSEPLVDGDGEGVDFPSGGLAVSGDNSHGELACILGDANNETANNTSVVLDGGGTTSQC